MRWKEYLRSSKADDDAKAKNGGGLCRAFINSSPAVGLTREDGTRQDKIIFVLIFRKRCAFNYVI